MRYPMLTEIATSRDMIDAFGGYNHNLRIGSGEFYDMQNMTSDHYPIMSPRRARGLAYTPDAKVNGIIAKDAPCYVDGEYFVMNEYRVNMGLTDEPKTLVSMGAYVIILPDKKYINTADISDFGSIEASRTTAGTVSFELCRLNGDAYAVTYKQGTEPEGASNMDLWIDTSATPNVLKQFSETSGLWVSIATTYIKISADGIGAAFQKYDGVTISGLKGEELIDSVSGDVIEDTCINAIDGSFVVWDRGEDFIVILGILNESRSLSNAVTVERTMPNMDFIIESKNRLWGCRYGEAVNGEIVNEIYCSKLGDFKNWNCFMGISTDSYRASCGTDGQFTGAISHGGYPLFFKEGYLHKVYGDYPSNFSIQDLVCRGVQKGSSKSLAIVNEVLYYKSRLGVCAYDGSLPMEISTALGDTAYFNAVAGSHGNKYYISMADAEQNGDYHLFVYDTVKGMWHKEDHTQVDAFCSCSNELYYIDHADGKVKTVFGSGAADTATVEWMVETGILGVDSPDMKYISKLNIRMAMDVESSVAFYIEYDSMGTWEHVSTIHCSSLRSFTAPIRPRRCDHMRLRIVGVGNAKVFSICKTIGQGSDLR